MADERPRLLVVDDEPSMRKLLVSALGSAYEVATAAAADEALAELDRAGSDVDLMLTDVMMPGMDGLDLIVEARKRRPDLLVVVMTAYQTDDRIVEALRRGAWDFLSKPFSIERLLITIRTCLQRRKEMQQAPDLPEVRYDENGWLELVGASDFEYVERFRRFTSLLFETQLDEDVIEDLRIAVDEIGRNAVEWGNRFGPDKRVRLAYRIFPEKVMIRIEDEGTGFDPERVPDPSADPVKLMLDRSAEGKRLGGYGIHIVRNLMDEVIYGEAGNAVVMAKYIRAASAEAFRVENGTLQVTTDLSWSQSGRLLEACETLLSAGDGPVTVDLSKVKYVASSCWRKLLKAHFQAEQVGRRLTVRIPPSLEEVFLMAGLDRVLTLEIPGREAPPGAGRKGGSGS